MECMINAKKKNFDVSWVDVKELESEKSYFVDVYENLIILYCLHVAE